MSEALVNSQTQRQWCYRALTAEARMGELEELLKAATDDAKEAEAYAGELEADLAKAVDKLTILEKAASDVSRPGAVTGSQWGKLTFAILTARTTLAELKGTDDA